MDQALQQRLERLLQRTVATCSRIERGYTPAERWSVRFSDGSSAFVKVGASPLTAEFLRDEHRRYLGLRGDFMPRLFGFEDDADRPLLVIEDLRLARWPPPWLEGDFERLVATLARVAKTRPLPDDLPSLAADAFGGWREVAENRAPFLALQLCSEDWLSLALPALIEAESAFVLEGDDLVHCDVRSDNLCLLGERVLLVDWNLARRGNSVLDLAFAAPSVRLEGGPLPEELVGASAPAAALVSGFFAARAGLPPIPDAPGVRRIQARQLRIALSWVARALGLAPADLPWARNAMGPIHRAHARGEIDDDGWHREIEEVLADAYLASDDPRAQSGKSGDEVDWRWSRELVLDALPGGGSLLDIGCANGYLMESLGRWADERGIAVEPYGLDISWRLAALARRRLPHWQDRIWVGNAMTWTPPRRFDLVHTGIDYVPAPRQRDFLLRLLRDVVAPGGRLVIRAERVSAGQRDLADQVRELGLNISAILECPHPRTGELRRTVSISAGS